MSYWFKECPRCEGDLREEGDTFGSFITCMQCGYSLKGHEERILSSRGSLKAKTQDGGQVPAQ